MKMIPTEEWSFVNDISSVMKAVPNFSKSVLWIGEACFKLNVCVNRQNCVYWSDKNPHEIIQEELNVPGVTVWAGIWSQIVGPYFFFEGTITADAYLEMLRDVVLPELENSPQYEDVTLIWQQDGAPPHYGLNV
jgi:hypothetical protein